MSQIISSSKHHSGVGKNDEGKGIFSKLENDLPQILACGYRRIRIQKSGLSFPTFLVSLPDHHQTAWRSKRDFLLLARATASCNNRGTVIRPFPKAMFQKLSDKAPWWRPLPTDDLNDFNPTVTMSNNYHVSMKKSILQLDQFLQSVRKVADSGDFDVKEAWEIFCRPGDTEGLIAEKDSSVTAEQVDQVTAFDGKASKMTTSKQESSRLGQYFCSSQNANQVAQIVVEKTKYVLQSDAAVLFLEPSCGHGDIVQALIDELVRQQISSSNVKIQGYDIDPNAIRTCKNRNVSSDYEISWTCENFLESKCLHSQEITVVCFGGPPYTTGAGSSSDIQRDLPALFIRHCIDEWKASCIFFLMPDRYRENPKSAPPDRFQCENLDIQSSTFFFQGSIQVTQPSFLQCLFSTKFLSRNDIRKML